MASRCRIIDIIICLSRFLHCLVIVCFVISNRVFRLLCNWLTWASLYDTKQDIYVNKLLTLNASLSSIFSNFCNPLKFLFNIRPNSFRDIRYRSVVVSLETDASVTVFGWKRHDKSKVLQWRRLVTHHSQLLSRYPKNYHSGCRGWSGRSSSCLSIARMRDDPFGQHFQRSLASFWRIFWVAVHWCRFWCREPTKSG